MLKEGTWEWAEILMDKGVHMRRVVWLEYFTAITALKDALIVFKKDRNNGIRYRWFEVPKRDFRHYDDWEYAQTFNLGDL